jgi:hypothetical protein
VRLPADIMFLSANDSGLITYRLGSQSHLPAIQINPVLPTCPEGCISDHIYSLCPQHPVSASQFIGTVAFWCTSNHDSCCETSLGTCLSSFGNFPPRNSNLGVSPPSDCVCRQLFPPFQLRVCADRDVRMRKIEVYYLQECMSFPSSVNSLWNPDRRSWQTRKKPRLIWLEFRRSPKEALQLS